MFYLFFIYLVSMKVPERNVTCTRSPRFLFIFIFYCVLQSWRTVKRCRRPTVRVWMLILCLSVQILAIIMSRAAKSHDGAHYLCHKIKPGLWFTINKLPQRHNLVTGLRLGGYVGFKWRQSKSLTSPDVFTRRREGSESPHTAPAPLLCPRIIKSELLNSIDPLKALASHSWWPISKSSPGFFCPSPALWPSL